MYLNKISTAFFCIYCFFSKGFQIVDALVTPIATFSSELWLPYVIPKKIYDGKSPILNAREDFPPERLNQQVCRLLLSVHKKSSWLAVLGDLGRYPLLINSLTHTFNNYHWWLKNKVNKNILIPQTFCEMNEFKEAGDCWLAV